MLAASQGQLAQRMLQPCRVKQAFWGISGAACQVQKPIRELLPTRSQICWTTGRKHNCRACFPRKAITAAARTSADTAKHIIEEGLLHFQKKEYQQALTLFQLALDSGPKPEEAQAAVYNAACCQTKLKLWQEAAASISEAVNTYNLKLKVAMEDKDLAPLRERREWQDAVESMQGGLSRRNLVGLRAEQKSPFRLFRLVASGGLGTGALVGLLIIGTRLISALKGGEGAPDLQETLQNLSINGAAVGILGFIFARDVKGQQSDRDIIEREEALARLQVKIGQDRVVTLGTLRGSARPVLVWGSKSQVSRAIKAAAPVLDALRTRGISVVALPSSQDDPSARLAALKAEFRSSKGFSKGAETSAPAASTSGRERTPNGGRRFELEPYNMQEWTEWLADLKKEGKVSSDHLYIQIQLDGSVRSSGVGSPPWQKFCEDLPPLDSLRTRMTDGLRK